MKKSMKVLAVTLIISLTFISVVLGYNDRATHTISVTIPERVEISLSTANIDFEFLVDGSTVLEDYLEVTHRCNKSGGDWQLTVSGSDFFSTNSTYGFSVDYLKWKKHGDSAYQAMPKTVEGSSGAVVVSGSDPGQKKTKVHYEMTMPTNVHAGTYRNTVTYTLLVP